MVLKVALSSSTVYENFGFTWKNKIACDLSIFKKCSINDSVLRLDANTYHHE